MATIRSVINGTGVELKYKLGATERTIQPHIEDAHHEDYSLPIRGGILNQIPEQPNFIEVSALSGQEWILVVKLSRSGNTLMGYRPVDGESAGEESQVNIRELIDPKAYILYFTVEHSGNSNTIQLQVVQWESSMPQMDEDLDNQAVSFAGAFLTAVGKCAKIPLQVVLATAGPKG